jgi:hypothetical protein
VLVVDETLQIVLIELYEERSNEPVPQYYPAVTRL